MKLTVFVWFLFVVQAVFSQACTFETQGLCDALASQRKLATTYVSYESFVPKQAMHQKLWKTTSFREEDYLLADFLNEFPPFGLEFVIETFGYSNPNCGDNAYTWFHIIQNEQAAAFF